MPRMISASRTAIAAVAAVVLAIAALGTPADAAPKVTAFTGFLPPLSVNPRDKGIAVDLMEIVAQRVGFELDVRFQPWKRAQVSAEATPGSLIFSIARTKARLDRYYWIAPLVFTQSSFVTLADPIDGFEDALRTGARTGVLLGSARARFLRRKGLTTIVEVSSEDQIAAMLDAGRVEAWYTMDWRAAYLFRQQQLDPSRLVIGKPAWVSAQYLAANKDFDRALAARIADVVNALVGTPEYQAVIDRYIR